MTDRTPPERPDEYTARQDPPPAGAETARASFSTMDEARSAVERLETGGVPADAIALAGDVNEERAGYDSERHLFSDVGKAVVVWGGLGAIAGAILGALFTIPFPELGLVWAAVFGGIFGAGVGGSIGGLMATKYNSPAWTETYQAVPEGPVTIEVAHSDNEIVSRARDILANRSD
jgi:hypothetical protein